MPRDFDAIDLAALDSVTGGRRTATSSTSSDDRLLDALDRITSSLAELGKNQSQPSSSGLDQLMPILMMQLLNRGNGTGGGFGSGNGTGGGCF